MIDHLQAEAILSESIRMLKNLNFYLRWAAKKGGDEALQDELNRLQPHLEVLRGMCIGVRGEKAEQFFNTPDDEVKRYYEKYLNED